MNEKLLTLFARDPVAAQPDDRAPLLLKSCCRGARETSHTTLTRTKCFMAIGKRGNVLLGFGIIVVFSASFKHTRIMSCCVLFSQLIEPFLPRVELHVT